MGTTSPFRAVQRKGYERTWRLKMGVVVVWALLSSPEWMALMMARV